MSVPTPFQPPFQPGAKVSSNPHSNPVPTPVPSTPLIPPPAGSPPPAAQVPGRHRRVARSAHSHRCTAPKSAVKAVT